MRKIARALYRHIPGKKYLFLVLRMLVDLPLDIYQHLHFRGVISVNSGPQSSFKMISEGNVIENDIFWSGLYRGWEGHSLKLWSELCKESRIVLDIGANTGIYSLLAASINPQASIFSFEPVERVYQKLMDNCKLNDFNIDCSSKAISNYDGEAIIYDPMDDHIYSVTVNKNLDPERSSEQVKVETQMLSSFIRDQELTSVDLIKIDVETHEPEVLEGMGAYLEKFKPTFIIEVLGEEIAQKLDSQLVGLGYHYFNIDESGLCLPSTGIVATKHHNYLVCQPLQAQMLGLI